MNPLLILVSIEFVKFSGFEIDEKGKIPLACTILDSWVFDNFIRANELFTKDLRSPDIVY